MKKCWFQLLAWLLFAAMIGNSFPVFAVSFDETCDNDEKGILWPNGQALPTEPPSMESLANSEKNNEKISLSDNIYSCEQEITESPIVKELEEKREENVKHYQTADHSNLAVIYPSAVHYEENGIWKEIDNTLLLKEDQDGNIYIFHEDQLNSAYYDGIQLTKDDGRSYLYDSNGNLVSAVTAAEQTGFSYDENDNLLGISGLRGTSSYSYDENKNLVSATNSEGVEYTFDYDNFGHAIRSQMQGDSEKYITVSATYTQDGRNLQSWTDSRGNTFYNSYDDDNRLLIAQSDALNNTINYVYREEDDRLEQISAETEKGEISISYGYTGELLTAIGHNGFQYSMTYGKFGNQTSFAVGNQSITSNTYLPYNGLLTETEYGNGHCVSYAYDELGRILETSYDGEAAFRYNYDGTNDQRDCTGIFI